LKDLGRPAGIVLPASTSFRVLAEEIGLKLALAWESGGHCAASSFCVLADKISVKLAKFSFWLLGAREMYRIRSGVHESAWWKLYPARW